MYPMQKIMMQHVEKSLENADIILLTTEIGKLEDISILNHIKKKNKKIPILILINKIDKIGFQWNENILYDTILLIIGINCPPHSKILPISAKKMNQDLLINE